jgi:hypothetical protein
VIRMIDRGELAAYRLPNQRRDRRITHNAMIMFVHKNPDFRYMLDNLDHYDPSVDFPEGLEPPPALAVPVRSAFPTSRHRPRTVIRGKIVKTCTYSASEIAFVLGLARRTINSWLDSGTIRGFKLATAGLTPWRWRIPHGVLVDFLRRNPAFAYGWDRIRGCERNGDDHPG